MGSSCTALKVHGSRYKRARTRSGNLPTGKYEFPDSIDVHEKYAFTDNKLEEGATGHVIKGTVKNQPSIHVAIKIMPKTFSYNNHLNLVGNHTPKSIYKNEVQILKRIQHENIVQLIDVGEDTNNYYVILQLGKGGDLVSYIFDDSIVTTEQQAARWTRSMLETLKYLHSMHICHGDIKPENIVFKHEKGCAELLIIDFGLAKMVEDNIIYNDLIANKYYTPPEIARHYLANAADADADLSHLTGAVWKMCDIWAVGIISYIMVLKKLPFVSATSRGTFKRIVNDNLTVPAEISDGFRDFIYKILDKNPYERLQIDEALRHPWIKCIASADIELNNEVCTVLNLTQYGYQSKLKQLIIKHTCNHCKHVDDTSKILMHFKRLDRNNDGFLNEKQFETLLLDIGYDENMANYQALKIVKNADLTGDGTVDFDEFKYLWHRKLLCDDKYINQLFRTDDNQFIDAERIQLRFGGNLNLNEIKCMMKEWDFDNNCGKLSFNDFKKAMKEYTSKYLIYGYISKFIYKSNEGINIGKSNRTQIINTKETKLIVVDGNLYYNFPLLPHMTFNKMPKITERASAIKNIPSLIVKTIANILYNFKIN